MAGAVEIHWMEITTRRYAQFTTGGDQWSVCTLQLCLIRVPGGIRYLVRRATEPLRQLQRLQVTLARRAGHCLAAAVRKPLQRQQHFLTPAAH